MLDKIIICKSLDCECSNKPLFLTISVIILIYIKIKRSVLYYESNDTKICKSRVYD